ncbi:MAG: DUF664 domain-containing protein [Dermatophilaceae bacterium]|nr:DUF664 domain-containing protein [Dermatophilaceae bacterium]
MTIVEALYLAFVFDRPCTEDVAWWDGDAGPQGDVWAAEDETRARIVDRYRRVTALATVGAFDLDTLGEVPWWPGRHEVTLHRMLVHMIAETSRRSDGWQRQTWRTTTRG